MIQFPSPNNGWLRQLEDDNEADGDEDEGQVDEHHEAADAAGVRAKRVGGGHRLHDDPGLRGVVRAGGQAALGAGNNEKCVSKFLCSRSRGSK